MAIHENLTEILNQRLGQIGWSNAEMAKLACRDEDRHRSGSTLFALQGRPVVARGPCSSSSGATTKHQAIALLDLAAESFG
jgi:hypothetical protein